jgi:transcriptional regulator with XRE-family HTH domain
LAPQVFGEVAMAKIPNLKSAFARALGFSSEFISLLEADKRAPSLATLNKIAA